jgi:ferredoxin
MRIVIDDGLCTGNGRCYVVAPELFTDDDRGYGQVIGDGSIGEDQLDLARRSVIACPEQAITIEDE